jgi:sugar lactone lactonase YvrE
LKLTERQKLIFLVALVATLGIVFAINWAGKRVADLYGPTALAQASDGRVWLLLNHELHVLDRDGRSLKRIPAKALGIAPPIAALAPAADGAMLVGSRETGLVHLVDAGGALRASIDPAAGGGKRLFGAFHILPLPDSQDLIVADTSNHRALRLGRDGRVLRTTGSADGQPGSLHFPNGLALDRDGRVLLVDTNHHAVRVFTQDLEPVPAGGFAAEADKGYVWPALVGVAPDGARFVSIMADSMERGRVFRFGPEGKRLAELPLPGSADPSGILVRSDDVLVSDQHGLAILRYGLDGSRLGEFGDESLRAAYREIARLRDLYRTTISGGRILLFVMLAGLLLLLRKERRAQERAGASLAVQAVEYAKPSALRRTSFSFWAVLRVGFAIVALNVVANLLLWNLARPFDSLLLAAAVLDFLLVVVLPCAVGVWHFDRMLRAGKYSDILGFGAQTLLRRLGENLEPLLQPGEPVEELAVAGNVLGRVQLLVLTPRRLLVLTLRANLRSLARAQDVLRIAVSRVSARSRRVPFFTRLAGKLSTTSLRIEVGGKRHSFPVIDPVAAADLEQALASTAKGAGAGVAHLRDIALEGAPAGRRDGLIVPLVLSAIVPGLGQLHQQRLGIATITFVCVASWVLQMMGPLIAIARRTAEVDPLLPAVALAGYAFVWGVSLLDTYWAARAEGGR